MTKPQIVITATAAALTNFNSAANTVTNETFNLDANLWNIGIPLLDIDSGAGGLPGSENISVLPKRRVILVTGEFRGTESELRGFVNEIENQTKSATQAQKTYTTSIAKTYEIKFNNFTYVVDQLVPDQKLTYTLEMFTETAS